MMLPLWHSRNERTESLGEVRLMRFPDLPLRQRPLQPNASTDLVNDQRNSRLMDWLMHGIKVGCAWITHIKDHQP
jgi:hypothetical protein